MTINKAQGQLLGVVGLDQREALFTHGQLYVAFSRATSVAGVRKLMKPDAQRLTKNIVFPEVLLRLFVNT
jgi:ATP-dependent DNA helicase PIF1